jgi:hypothetical protein
MAVEAAWPLLWVIHPSGFFWVREPGKTAKVIKQGSS